VADAQAAFQRAGAERALLGGYVPLNHPSHPTRWNGRRKAALAAAEAAVERTTIALREAISHAKPPSE
jgi:hypothetical protein